MNVTIFYAAACLSALGILAAFTLYIIAKKFHIDEDPKIAEVEENLPAANCGGCEYPGCRSFAEAFVKADDISDLFCPVGGNETMCLISKLVGKEAPEHEPQVAVIRCSGSFEHRERTNIYDGPRSCSVSSNIYSGDTGCAFGCLGLGECVDACQFDAMYMDEKTGLPVIIEEKCTACNACVKICPKEIIELRNKGPEGKRVFVSCINEDKGGVAKKSCTVACIGCNKCEKVCDEANAITVTHYLAYVDFEKCTLCQKCVEVCPTDSILAVNLPETENAAETPQVGRILSPKENKTDDHA